MRILHLLSQLGLTGAEVYAQELSNQQIADGHQVYVISDKIHVSLLATYQSLEVSNNHWWHKHQVTKKLKQFLIENKIDVIHCHSRAAVRHAHRARQQLSIQQKISVHAANPINSKIAMVTTLHGRQHFSWSKRLQNIYGEYMIAICENVKKAQIQDFKSQPHTIKKIGNPFSTDQYQPRMLTEPKNQIAWIGRSTGPKGLIFKKFFLETAEELLRTYPQLKFDIICTKPTEFGVEFLEQIQKWNLQFQERIRILDQVTQLKSIYQQYDLVMGAGRVAIESCLLGVPCFAMGEASYHGLIHLNNLEEAMHSNFGDIDFLPPTKNPFSHWNFPQMKIDFLRSCRKLYAGVTDSLDDIIQIRSILVKNYDVKVIHEQVLETYRAAIFKCHVPQWIPILMYHKVVDQPIQTEHKIFITKDRFEEHCRFFKKQNFTPMWFSDLWPYWSGQKSFQYFPKKPIFLTFDDGYKNNLTIAEPILKHYQLKATIYLLANHQITQNNWDPNEDPISNQLLTFAEKNQLSPEVFEIGSHGYNHQHLTTISAADAFEDLKSSRCKLESEFGAKVYSFAYPFGSTSDALARLAQEAGYEFAVNTDRGGMLLSDDRFALFRVNIFPEDKGFALWKKTRPWYRKRFYKRRGQ